MPAIRSVYPERARLVRARFFPGDSLPAQNLTQPLYRPVNLWLQNDQRRRDAENLRSSITPWRSGAYQWEQIESGLEDVFISLMETARDNFS